MMVLDLFEEGVRCGFKFGQTPEGFYLAGEAVFPVEARALIRQVADVPAEGVAEQAGDLVVEVVPGGKGGEAFFKRRLVEIVPFDLAAGGTDGTLEALLDQRDGKPFLGHFLDDELEAVLAAEAFDDPAHDFGRAGDAEVDVQAGNVIALTRKFQHEGQGILAAGQGDEDAVLVGEQLSGFDAAGDLRGEEIPEAVFTESGVVARQGNDGRGGLAAFAYHDEANSGAGRGCALRIGWPGVKPVNWFFYLACESLVKPGKTGGTRGCGMIFLCGRGDCDSDHCLFPVKKGMSVYKTMSFHLNSGGFHVLQSV